MSNNHLLYSQVREAINKSWDPIGISAYYQEIDEYDSYVPSLCELLSKGATYEQIFDYLWIVETESIGLKGDKKATEDFAHWLIDLTSKFS
jgi:hypothetical protein